MYYNPGLPGGDNYNQPSYAQQITWLDYTILLNPNGVMTVLSKYGYIGYLAPQDPQEIKEACQILMEKNGDKAIIDLLRVHPDYDVIKETPVEGYYTKSELFNTFSKANALTPKEIDFKKGFLLIGGLLLVAALIN